MCFDKAFQCISWQDDNWGSIISTLLLQVVSIVMIFCSFQKIIEMIYPCLKNEIIL